MFSSFDYFAGAMAPFRRTLSSYPASFMEGKDRSDVESGNKIILPPSALDELARKNIQYPMLFKLTNREEDKATHCGVLEFVAEEGKAYLPYWMMNNLLLSPGSQIYIENVSLETATYMKIKPLSVDFLDISNPKAVLEKALRTFACLTINDIVVITYNEKPYELSVLELKPSSAVSIIECDMNVSTQVTQVEELLGESRIKIDASTYARYVLLPSQFFRTCNVVEFAPPDGYKEPETRRLQPDEDDEDDAIDYCSSTRTTAGSFSTVGKRLDGKPCEQHSSSDSQSVLPHQRGIPNYDYVIGTLNFKRVTAKPNESKESQIYAFHVTKGHRLLDDSTEYDVVQVVQDDSKPFQAFPGEGNYLKQKKRV